MGQYYSGRGECVLRDVPEVRKILNEFEEEYGIDAPDPVDITPGSAEPNTIRVEINWFGKTSAIHVEAIDKKLGELIPYIVGDEAIVFDYEHESEPDKMYIGTDEQRVNARSKVALACVAEAAGHLVGLDLAFAISKLEDVLDGKEDKQETTAQSDESGRVHEQSDEHSE